MNRPWMAMASLALVLCAGPALGQDCPETTVVGDFEVSLDDLVFDGNNTTLTYCITGLDNPGFHALSNWMLSLNPACLSPDELLDCSIDDTGSCYYQVDDPNLDLTGVKFDDIEVEVGETECYDVVLPGDWTTRLGQVVFGLKAANETSQGIICGPECCESIVSVTALPGEAPVVDVYLQHNLVSEVTTPIEYQLKDADGNLIMDYTDGPVHFVSGTEYIRSFTLPRGEELAPGSYTLRLRILGMSGYVVRSANFEVVAE